METEVALVLICTDGERFMYQLQKYDKLKLDVFFQDGRTNIA